jgi:hydroxymethylbilane synthase
VAALEHPATRACLAAERAFAARLQGSCQSPVAGFAELQGAQLRVRGLVGSPDGTKVYADEISGAAMDGPALGTSLADRLLAAGAGPLLDALRSAHGH